MEHVQNTDNNETHNL